jgi:hypothetical protein
VHLISHNTNKIFIIQQKQISSHNQFDFFKEISRKISFSSNAFTFLKMSLSNILHISCTRTFYRCKNRDTLHPMQIKFYVFFFIVTPCPTTIIVVIFNFSELLLYCRIFSHGDWKFIKSYSILKINKEFILVFFFFSINRIDLIRKDEKKNKYKKKVSSA